MSEMGYSEGHESYRSGRARGTKRAAAKKGIATGVHKFFRSTYATDLSGTQKMKNVYPEDGGPPVEEKKTTSWAKKGVYGYIALTTIAFFFDPGETVNNTAAPQARAAAGTLDKGIEAGGALAEIPGIIGDEFCDDENSACDEVGDRVGGAADALGGRTSSDTYPATGQPESISPTTTVTPTESSDILAADRRTIGPFVCSIESAPVAIGSWGSMSEAIINENGNKRVSKANWTQKQVLIDFVFEKQNKNLIPSPDRVGPEDVLVQVPLDCLLG